MGSRTRAAIIAAGEAASFERTTGASALSLNAEAALDAIAEAGLPPKDVDGLITGYTLVEPHFMFSTVLAEYLGIHPTYHTTMVNGGATPCEMVRHAAAAIGAGDCTKCLVVYGDRRGTGPATVGGLQAIVSVRGHPEFEHPFGLPAAGPEAMMARRYLHEFEVEPTLLAEVAVAARAHAARNPKALRRQPLTVDEVLDSPMISEPLHALDCCLVSNFGGAVIVTSETMAHDLTDTPIVLAASAGVHSHQHVSQAASLVDFGIRAEVDGAFSRAGLSRRDIDVAGVYDGFTITAVLNLEALGFAEPGGAADLVMGGGIGPGGELPVNTHGGMLSCAHGGILHLTECVRQLQGRSADRQIDGATHGLVHGDGASQSTHSILLLSRADA